MPEQREYVESIHNSGDALLGIISDILDFSKIESGWSSSWGEASPFQANWRLAAELTSDGPSALARFAQDGRFDVVLLDCDMPGMDGLEAARRLRRQVPVHSPPYAPALTANARKEDYDACLEAGMHAYMSKPIRADDLVDSLIRAHAWNAHEAHIRFDYRLAQ